jgi:hypothetical protein
VVDTTSNTTLLCTGDHWISTYRPSPKYSSCALAHISISQRPSVQLDHRNRDEFPSYRTEVMGPNTVSAARRLVSKNYSKFFLPNEIC